MTKQDAQRSELRKDTIKALHPAQIGGATTLHRASAGAEQKVKQDAHRRGLTEGLSRMPSIRTVRAGA